MTWHSNSNSPTPDNQDNYLDAINRAKEELNLINNDIKIALEQKSELLAGNASILKEKLDEIEHAKEGILSARTIVDDLRAKNEQLAKELEEEKGKLCQEQEEFAKQQSQYDEFIDSKSKDFEFHDSRIVQLLNDMNSKEISIDAQMCANSKLLESIEIKSKEAQETLNRAIEENDKAKAYKDDANTKLDACKAIQIQIEAAQEKANQQFIETKSNLEQCEKIKQENEEVLKVIAQKEANIKDLIIENKKKSLEANNTIEASKKNIAELNQKIADLENLKQALANEENKNVT
jgi:chromosome segregation ATPase